MKKFLAGLLQKQAPESTTVIEVPACPPADNSINAFGIDDLVASQSVYIDHLRRSFQPGHEVFDTHVMPLIRAYAAIAHLLPASENDHHNTLGGLFRHSLEVAFYTHQKATTRVQEYAKFQEKEARLDRFLTACTIAGLYHDAGKPLTDFKISDPDNRLTFPSTGRLRLLDWLEENELTEYIAPYRPVTERRNRHVNLSAIALDRFMPTETMSWLTHYDQLLYEDMLNAVSSHTTTSSQMTWLVAHGDAQSCKKWAMENFVSTEALPQSAQLYRVYLDAIRRHAESVQLGVRSSCLTVIEEIMPDGSKEPALYLLLRDATNKTLQDVIQRQAALGYLVTEANLVESLSGLGLLSENEDGSYIWPLSTTNAALKVEVKALRFEDWASVLTHFLEPPTANTEFVLAKPAPVSESKPESTPEPMLSTEEPEEELKNSAPENSESEKSEAKAQVPEPTHVGTRAAAHQEPSEISEQEKPKPAAAPNPGPSAQETHQKAKKTVKVSALTIHAGDDFDVQHAPPELNGEAKDMLEAIALLVQQNKIQLGEGKRQLLTLPFPQISSLMGQKIEAMGKVLEPALVTGQRRRWIHGPVNREFLMLNTTGSFWLSRMIKEPMGSQVAAAKEELPSAPQISHSEKPESTAAPELISELSSELNELEITRGLHGTSLGAVRTLLERLVKAASKGNSDQLKSLFSSDLFPEMDARIRKGFGLSTDAVIEPVHYKRALALVNQYAATQEGSK